MCDGGKRDWEEELDKERQAIRTHMQYSLMGNYTDGEWEVIINNIQVLLAQQRSDIVREVEEIVQKDKNFIDEEEFVCDNDYNQALSDAITLIKQSNE